MKRLSILVCLLLLGDIILPINPANAQGSNCLAAEAPGCMSGLPTAEYQQLLADMQANAAPDVTEIPVDTKEVYAYSFWKVLPDADKFDGPNGSVIGKMGDGFNFVIIRGKKDGFAQLKDGTWVRLSSLKQTTASVYAGVVMDKPLKYPMAWVIQASIPSRYPGGPNNDGKTPAINRYKRLNIFATVKVGNWDWYLVGPGQWLEQRKVARVISTTKPEGAGSKWVAVDLYEQVLTAYEGDQMVYATLISSGLTQWQTNMGTFKVWQRFQLTAMSGAMGQPDFYSLPSVPYVMYFDKDISLHGTYWHDGYGYKRSHGCVNMSISDARWVYNWSTDAPEMTVYVWRSRG